MSKEPERELTAKQKAFVQAYTTPGKGLNNASQAYRIAYPNTKAGHNKLSSRLMANDGIKTEIAVIQAETAAKAGFTREKQLKDLEYFKSAAKSDKNHAAGISAIREQNEMLGYHRELASNPEKEAERAAKLSKEDKEVARIAAEQRTNEIAEGGHIKVGGA